MFGIPTEYFLIPDSLVGSPAKGVIILLITGIVYFGCLPICEMMHKDKRSLDSPGMYDLPIVLTAFVVAVAISINYATTFIPFFIVCAVSPFIMIPALNIPDMIRARKKRAR